jgi:hypothetical protein
VIGLAPRALEHSVRPRRLSGVVVRPLNVSVRVHMRTPASVALVAMMVIGSAAGRALAVCLDPETLVSNYHVPLEQEVRTAAAIIIGEVVDVNRIHDDPSYPDYYSASIFTVRVIRQLKGDLPKTLKLRTENDSGRYDMAVGETHLLFLTRLNEYHEDFYSADSCGSSSLLPGGNHALEMTEHLLGATAHAP